MCVVSIVFFFFKKKTAYELRISDWSSDVCSSDLAGLVPASNPPRAVAFEARWTPEHVRGDGRAEPVLQPNAWSSNLASRNPPRSTCNRSEERRVGKECFSTCISRWTPSHYQNTQHLPTTGADSASDSTHLP